MSDSRKLLKEYATYPSYMTFSFDEMQELLNSFMSIISSIKQSLKLAWATIELNLKVIQGSWTNNKKMIEDAFTKFEGKRQKYDREMAENLKYFKKYYLDSRIDTLGGFGPRALAFAVNPMLFVAGGQARKTIERGTGVSTSPEWMGSSKKVIDPYDVKKPFRSVIAPGRDSADKVAGSDTSTTAAKPGKSRGVGVTPNVQRALDFFGFEGSRLSEAVELPTTSPEQAKEAQKLRDLAADYVRSETDNSKQLLEKVSNLNSAMKELLNAKTFEELIQVMKKIEQTGIKMSTQGIQTASKNIRKDFERQQKEDSEKFESAVALMQQRSPDIKDSDPVEAAMKFIFGISKTKMQQQLVKSQEELITSARKVMNLPVDPTVRSQLQQSDLGKQYLMMVDDFEKRLESGERETEAAKKSLKSAVT